MIKAAAAACWKPKKIIRKYVIFFIITSKTIPCYVISEVSLKRCYFALMDNGLLKTLKLAFIDFLIQTHVHTVGHCSRSSSPAVSNNDV